MLPSLHFVHFNLQHHVEIILTIDILCKKIEKIKTITAEKAAQSY